MLLYLKNTTILPNYGISISIQKCFLFGLGKIDNDFEVCIGFVNICVFNKRYMR